MPDLYIFTTNATYYSIVQHVICGTEISTYTHDVLSTLDDRNKRENYNEKLENERKEKKKKERNKQSATQHSE